MGGEALSSAWAGVERDSRAPSGRPGSRARPNAAASCATGSRQGRRRPPGASPISSGETVSLSDFLGTPLLLVFSDPDCQPCQVLAPRLERLHRRGTDPSIVMVSRGDLEENRRKAAEHQLSFPIVRQRHWEVSRAYGMFATPIGYLIDSAGSLASGAAVGAEAILQLIAHSNASPTEEQRMELVS